MKILGTASNRFNFDKHCQGSIKMTLYIYV